MYKPSAPKQHELPNRKVVPAWRCRECQSECVPVRSESRCLCGHRLRQHSQGQSEGFGALRCDCSGCSCPSFFYIVAEGSWILRCRCKHRHTDHNPTTHACCKAGCPCDRFDSPWVCNCNHPWQAHEMVMKEQQLHALSALVAEGSSQAGGAAVLAADDLSSEVNRWDLLKRGD